MHFNIMTLLCSSLIHMVVSRLVVIVVNVVSIFVFPFVLVVATVHVQLYCNYFNQ